MVVTSEGAAATEGQRPIVFPETGGEIDFSELEYAYQELGGNGSPGKGWFMKFLLGPETDVNRKMLLGKRRTAKDGCPTEYGGPSCLAP